jgi:hypothetical protein
MANTPNQLVDLEEEAENNASISNTVPIASGGEGKQMSGIVMATREARVWTPQVLPWHE